MNLLEILYGDGDMECLKINQVCWDNRFRILKVDLEDICLLLSFRKDFGRNYGNKYLTYRSIASIYGNRNSLRMINKNYKKIPVRNIKKLIFQIIWIYDGPLDVWVMKWIKEKKKKTTKD